jgi:hypothetical protein
MEYCPVVVEIKLGNFIFGQIEGLFLLPAPILQIGIDGFGMNGSTDQLYDHSMVP